MRSVLSIVTFSITAAVISTIASTAVAQDKPAQWIDFGVVGKGEQLQLDTNNIIRSTMPIDDKTNMEGISGDETTGIPMRKVIFFNYKIGGRTRHAYTVSCQGRNLKAAPSWRTAITYIDYWPQYFSVQADSPASKQMLKNVCVLAMAK